MNIKHKKWTKEEDKWLSDNYFEFDLDFCSKQLNRTKNSISLRAVRVLNMRRPIIWTKEKTKLLKQYYDNKSLYEMSGLLNIPIDTIIAKGNKMGLKLCREFRGQRKRRDINLNVNFFEQIDNYEKAYLLGWIWSDGSISNGVLRFCLSKKDKDVLFYIKKTLNSQNKISYYQNKGFDYVRFAVFSVKMTDDLLKLNISFNKTYSQIKPIVPEEYMDGFILGLLDGDGTAGIVKKYTRISFSGTIATMEFVKSFFDKKFNKNFGRIQTVSYTTLFGRLDISCQEDVLSLYKFLYKRPPFFLRRKEKIFRNVFSFQYKQYQSKYNGVGILQNKYVARIGYDHMKEFLGYFDNEIDAAKSYDKRLKEINGDLDKLNFK